MIALIEIPHQRPARINWYDNEQSLISDAEEYAIRSGRDSDPALTVDEAAHLLADDWNCYILVRSAADIVDVENYQGHQEINVRCLSAELRADIK